MSDILPANWNADRLIEFIENIADLFTKSEEVLKDWGRWYWNIAHKTSTVENFIGSSQKSRIEEAKFLRAISDGFSRSEDPELAVAIAYELFQIGPTIVVLAGGGSSSISTFEFSGEIYASETATGLATDWMSITANLVSNHLGNLFEPLFRAIGSKSIHKNWTKNEISIESAQQVEDLLTGLFLPHYSIACMLQREQYLVRHALRLSLNRWDDNGQSQKNKSSSSGHVWDSATMAAAEKYLKEKSNNPSLTLTKFVRTYAPNGRSFSQSTLLKKLSKYRDKWDINGHSN